MDSVAQAVKVEAESCLGAEQGMSTTDVYTITGKACVNMKTVVAVYCVSSHLPELSIQDSRLSDSKVP